MSRMLRIACIRVLASAAVWLAGNAWGGSAPTQEIRVSLRRWSDWWMNEVGRQSVPSPQLLHVIGQKDGWLCPADDIDVFPSGFGYRHEWHQANAGLISTEAFVLPSAAQHMSNWEFGAFFVSHDYDGTPARPMFETFTGRSPGLPLAERHCRAWKHSVRCFQQLGLWRRPPSQGKVAQTALSRLL